jgi:hypothetical protein
MREKKNIPLNKKCLTCSNDCKQNLNIKLIRCPKYKKGGEINEEK